MKMLAARFYAPLDVRIEEIEAPQMSAFTRFDTRTDPEV